MSQHQIWCDALGRALLASLPEEVIVTHWGPIPAETSDSHARPGDRLREALPTWAREDHEVRRWALGAWREAHPDVVAAADQAVIEGLTGDAARALVSFPPEEAVLALLTDEFDDGRELATTFARRVDDGGPRRALFGALARLVGDSGAAARRSVRVVIIGGRQRDESTVGQRLFEGAPSRRSPAPGASRRRSPASCVTRRGRSSSRGRRATCSRITPRTAPSGSGCAGGASRGRPNWS